jgi:PAS domain S-box-containing protein
MLNLRKIKILRNFKDDLQDILELLPALIVKSDQDCRIVQCNKAVEEVLGYRPDMLIGRSLGILWVNESEWEEVRVLLSHGKSLLNREMECRHRGGFGVPMEYSIATQVGNKGSLSSAIFMGMDITVRKQLEAQLLEAERQKALSYFSSAVIHDIRTPLIGIHNTLLLFWKNLKEDRLTPEERQTVQELVTATGLLLGIVDDRLDMYQGHRQNLPLRYSSFLLSKAVREVIAVLTFELKRQDAKIVLESPDREPLITADRKRIQRVFINLLDNAIKYSPFGGKILVRVAYHNERGSPYVLCSVEDEGPGIPEDKIEKLFAARKPLESREYNQKRRGLGLQFCRIIISSHRGKIWVENKRRGGALIAFQLPLGGKAGADQSLAGG